jgi:hypothetical protein
LYDDARTYQRQTETGVQFCFFLLLAIDGGVVSFTFRPSYSRRYLDKALYGSPGRYDCNQSVCRPNILGSSKNLFHLASCTSAPSMASSHCNLLPPEVAPVCCLSHAILDARNGWLIQLLYISIHTFVKLLLLLRWSIFVLFRYERTVAVNRRLYCTSLQFVSTGCLSALHQYQVST